MDTELRNIVYERSVTVLFMCIFMCLRVLRSVEMYNVSVLPAPLVRGTLMFIKCGNFVRDQNFNKYSETSIHCFCLKGPESERWISGK
jgi:hypothetical protein